MKKANSICVLVGIFLVFSTSCASNATRSSQRKDAIMFGMLYDYENNPVQGVTVSIDGKRVGESDVLGRFVVDISGSGGHSISIAKADHETIEDSFTFERTAMLYYRMITAGQLLDEAERSLDSLDAEASRGYIDRALRLDPRRYDALFLRAVASRDLGDTEGARRSLDEALAAGYSGPCAAAFSRCLETTDCDPAGIRPAGTTEVGE